MCQVFDPVHPALASGPAAWPDDPQGAYAGSLSKDGRHLHFTLTLEVRPDGIAAALDVPSLGVVGAPFAMAAYEPPTLVLHMSGATGDGFSWVGTVDGDTIAGRWAGAGIAATFEMTRGPIEPDCFTMQEVACQVPGGRLAGSLIRPLGVGPHPAALHLPGPGPTTRDESRYLAQYLARHGIASLILDAPGAGQSTGNCVAADLEDQARDAVAAVRLLRAADGIDPGRAGLVAAGKSGWAAAMAACLLGDPAFLILRSTPVLSPAERGLFDPVPLLRALDAPVLALYGERDDRLRALPCAETLVSLRRGDRRDVTVHVFPDTDHGMIQRPPPLAAFDWPRLPAGYLPAIAAWLQTRVLRPA